MRYFSLLGWVSVAAGLTASVGCSKKQKTDMSDPIGIRVQWSGPAFDMAVATAVGVKAEDHMGAFSSAMADAAKACPALPTIAPDLVVHMEGEVRGSILHLPGGQDPILQCVSKALEGRAFPSPGRDFAFYVEVKSVRP